MFAFASAQLMFHWWMRDSNKSPTGQRMYLELEVDKLQRLQLLWQTSVTVSESLK